MRGIIPSLTYQTKKRKHLTGTYFYQWCPGSKQDGAQTWYHRMYVIVWEVLKLGQTPSNGNVSIIYNVFSFAYAIRFSHEKNKSLIIILARTNTSKNYTLSQGMLHRHLVSFGYFLGNNHSQISGLWGWIWHQWYVSSLDCWSWWSEMGTNLSWSTLCSLEQGKNYGDLSRRYFLPTGFRNLLVRVRTFHNSYLGRPPKEQHNQGRT